MSPQDPSPLDRLARDAESGTRPLSSGLLFAVVVGVLGLGGSLIIATADLDGPAPIAHVRPAAPEILYTAPVASFAGRNPEETEAAAAPGLLLANPGEEQATLSIQRQARAHRVPALRLATALPEKSQTWEATDFQAPQGRPAFADALAPDAIGSELAALQNAAIPEPSTWLLLLSAGAAFGVRCFRRLRR